jgi:glycine hydroxymethyltransferase
MNLKHIKRQDKTIYKWIDLEAKRQKEGLEMIPSENYTSPAVMEATGSILTNKYSEGYPKKRYYGGNQFVDEIEIEAQQRAKELFGVEHVNVQPYSGSPANLAVYLATLNPGDTVMGLNLTDGGHLTHGWKVSATGIFYHSVPYHVKETGRVDLDEVWKLAKENKPKLIWMGGTAYPFELEFEDFAQIADDSEAYLACDIAHIAGLIVAGVHKSPVPFCHVVTTTTHKTLRGPRGGMIMVTKRGLRMDPELATKIDRAVFPGLGGGPHNHQTAAVAVALKEAASLKFKKYGQQIAKNAKALARELIKEGLELVGRGTENHLLLMDLTKSNGSGSGILVQDGLGLAGITVNKNTIPSEPSSPYFPSGIRLGTPALTTRGMKESDMRKVAKWIYRVINAVGKVELPEIKEQKAQYLTQKREELAASKEISQVKLEVKRFATKFPVPGL